MANDNFSGGEPRQSALQMAMLCLTFCCLFLVNSAAASLALSGPSFTEVCERSAEVAAAQTGVPVSVLKAVSLTETGRKFAGEQRSWPWTVNMEGVGAWFDTLQDAKTYVYRHFKNGARSFDIGCFQINYKWHHQHFTSLEEMFEPEQNALYAARFLTDLFQEFGDWTAAAGAFHSRTPILATGYKQRFSENRARFLVQDDPSFRPLRPEGVGRSPTRTRVSARVEPRENRFPLLTQSDGPTQLGSLVPQTAAAGLGSMLAAPPRSLW